MAEPLDPKQELESFAEAEQEFTGYFEPQPVDDVGANPDNLGDVQATPAFYVESPIATKYRYVSGEDVQYDCGSDDPMGGSATTTGRRVKAHNGFWIKEVTFSIERRQSWPLIPHPHQNDPNLVLVDAEIEPMKPGEGPDGAAAFRVSGKYTYKMIRGLDGPGPLPTAVYPDSKASAGDNTVPVATFDSSMLLG